MERGRSSPLEYNELTTDPEGVLKRHRQMTNLLLAASDIADNDGGGGVFGCGGAN
jgi:hypothetical protein